MTNADANNPLLSTPVASIAIDLFKSEMRGCVPEQHKDSIAVAVAGCVGLAEEIVRALQERGHLPGTLVEVDEPKADDATLILQGMVLGEVTWEPYGRHDPRGRLRIGTAIDGYQLDTKLKGGLPDLTPTAREEIVRRVKPLLRKL